MDRKTVVLLLTFRRVHGVKRILETITAIDLPIVVSIDRDETLTELEQEKAFEEVKTSFPTVEFCQRSRNFGLAEHFSVAVKESFAEFDNVIVIEDDIRIPTAVLLSTQILLQKRFPKEVGAISLFPGLPSFSALGFMKNSWRRSPYFCPWGFALQREDWAMFNLRLPLEADQQLLNSKAIQTMSSIRQLVWKTRVLKVIANPQFTYDTQIQFYLFTNDKQVYVPLFRGSDNCGFADEFAVHTKGRLPRWIIGNAHRKKFRDKHLAHKFLVRVCTTWDSFTIAGDRRVPWRL